MTDPPNPLEASPTSRGIVGAALLIALGNLSSRLLGLVREQVIAALFGATGPTSAFRTATRVSTAAYDLLLAGAITSALVPVLSDYAAAGRRAELSRIVSTLVNVVLIGVGAMIAALVVGAPWLVSALGADPDHFDLAVGLTRVALPSIVLLGLAGIHAAVLQAGRRFALTAAGVALYNLGIIAAALTLTGSLWIYALAVGLVLGALLQLTLQLPAWRGLRYVPVIDLGHPGVRLILRLYAPVFVGLLASYAIVVVDTNLAWRTGEDSVAAMGFATTLIQFPIGLVGAAASIAILPSLSRLASSSSHRFVDLLLAGIKTVLLLMVPAFGLLVVLREPLVALLFERAAFDAVATRRTAEAFLAYSPQLPFVVVDQLLIIAFYARKNTTTPVLVGVAGAVIYLAVALATIAPLGMPGLALANAVQNSSHAVILYVLLARQEPALRSRSLSSFVVKVVVAGSLGAIACAAGGAWAEALLTEDRTGPRLLGLVVAGATGLAAYAGALAVLRVQELWQVPRQLRHQANVD